MFPNGRVDTSWGKPHRVKVLSEGVTGEETKILHENVQSGTAGRSAINCPTAAKTGTTSELIDAWLDGYNSEYSTVVWMGYPNRRVSMTDVHGEPQQGGYLPAEIWHAYMTPVTEGHPCAPVARIERGARIQAVLWPLRDDRAGDRQPAAKRRIRARRAKPKPQNTARSRRRRRPRKDRPRPPTEAPPAGPTGGAAPK